MVLGPFAVLSTRSGVKLINPKQGEGVLTTYMEHNKPIRVAYCSSRDLVQRCNRNEFTVHQNRDNVKKKHIILEMLLDLKP